MADFQHIHLYFKLLFLLAFSVQLCITLTTELYKNHLMDTIEVWSLAHTTVGTYYLIIKQKI